VNRKSIIVAGLALALSASAALAQAPTTNNPPPPPPRGGPGGPGFGGFGGHRGGPGGWMGGRMARLPPEEMAKRQADAFAKMDANRDGKVTFQEFRADLERRKVEREEAMFKRFSGGQDSFTLDQLKARGGRGDRGGRGGRGPGRGGPDQGPPPAR
jgi:hypothetical protein